MARNNEPALGRKTPFLICSMRTEIPYPCIGSKARVFRTSMPKVPCITSVALSGIKVLSSYWHPSGAYACPTGCQEEEFTVIHTGKDLRSEGAIRDVPREVRGRH